MVPPAVDRPLLVAGVAQLKEEGGTVGHYTHIGAKSDWDGRKQAMSQYVDEEVRADDFELDILKSDDLEAFYSSKAYPTRDAMNSWWGRKMISWFFVPWTNKDIARQREVGVRLLHSSGQK